MCFILRVPLDLFPSSFILTSSESSLRFNKFSFLISKNFISRSFVVFTLNSVHHFFIVFVISAYCYMIQNISVLVLLSEFLGSQILWGFFGFVCLFFLLHLRTWELFMMCFGCEFISSEMSLWVEVHSPRAGAFAWQLSGITGSLRTISKAGYHWPGTTFYVFLYFWVL